MTNLKLELQFTIPLNPVTKKNSSRAFNNIVLPSKAYSNYEKNCRDILYEIYLKNRRNIKFPIAQKVNVAGIFYTKLDYENGKVRIDLPNLINALHDVLVKWGIMQDDCTKFIPTVDGSKVLYDKLNPRTEVIITEFMG